MSKIALKDKIEKMTKYHQVEVLRIITSLSPNMANENKNGTFINLTELPDNVIEELYKYATYIEHQQKQLKDVENVKDELEIQFMQAKPKVL